MPVTETSRAVLSEDLDLDNPEFQDTFRLVNNSRTAVFLTGKAGTGKSTFLRYIIQNTNKKYVVLAPTGIAALNVGGQTIHSFFRLPFKPLLPDDPEFAPRKLRERLKYPSSHIKLLRSLELIVIDEISMVRADIIDMIDRILRLYSGNTRQPFGGKQLLMVGDVFQLEPVASGDHRDLIARAYATPHFFSANVFREIRPVPIELRKVYRQGNDAVFAALLDHVRVGEPTAEDIRMLNTRYVPDIQPNKNDMILTLTARRDMAAHINNQRIAELPGHLYTYEGNISGVFNTDALPTEKILELKIGAQVVFIKNDTERRWVNGTIGRVESCDEDSISVRTEDDVLHTVEREVWNNVRYIYNEEKRTVDEEVLGSFTQFPIRLAWAITIHKSQGLTFSKVIIDMGRGAFTGGQTYVALSRCQSLDGITLRTPVSARDIYVKDIIRRYGQTFNNKDSINQALMHARAERIYCEASRLADKGLFAEASDKFFEASAVVPVANSTLARRFVRRKMRVINHLAERIEDLEQQLANANKILNEVADEYVALACQAREEAWEQTAALSNLDKALSIVPTHWRAWMIRAEILSECGMAEDAETAAAQATRFCEKPETSLILLRGDIALQRGDSILAMDNYLSAERLDPDAAAVLRRIAELYEDLGDKKSAREYRRRLKSLRK